MFNKLPLAEHENVCVCVFFFGSIRLLHCVKHINDSVSRARKGRGVIFSDEVMCPAYHSPAPNHD